MAEEKQGFDYRTHIMNPKTGKLEIEQHYKMIVSRTEGTKIERPINSGKFFDGAGNRINPDPVPQLTAQAPAVEAPVAQQKVSGK